MASRLTTSGRGSITGRGESLADTHPGTHPMISRVTHTPAHTRHTPWHTPGPHVDCGLVQDGLVDRVDHVADEINMVAVHTVHAVYDVDQDLEQRAVQGRSQDNSGGEPGPGVGRAATPARVAVGS